jgi:hypothetical protein
LPHQPGARWSTCMSTKNKFSLTKFQSCRKVIKFLFSCYYHNQSQKLISRHGIFCTCIFRFLLCRHYISVQYVSTFYKSCYLILCRVCCTFIVLRHISCSLHILTLLHSIVLCNVIIFSIIVTIYTPTLVYIIIIIIMLDAFQLLMLSAGILISLEC